MSGLLFVIDYKKTFDSLEWSFILDTLRSYGVGPSLINWAKTQYGHIVLNNGMESNFLRFKEV